MEGFILAAGLGTRLLPLTADRPKALVEVGGVSLLERAIRRLEAAGIGHIVVNVHHFADMVVDFIEAHQWDATVEVSSERDQLLDTGGGLRHASSLFSGRENVLIHNVDILSDIDLVDVERRHLAAGDMVTLCVSRRDTKRLLAFDEDGCLLGRVSSDIGLKSPNTLFAFSGISVVSPALFPLLPEADHPYPVIDEYIRLSVTGYRVASYVHPAGRWLDVGRPETLKIAEQWIASSDK